jgi:hypothetical protein
MTKGLKLAGALGILSLCCLPLWGQVLPVPIPGGDIIQPFGLFIQFFPGVGTGFDGLNADPHGITNSRTFVAMGYTVGTATDNSGKTYTSSRTFASTKGITSAEVNGGAGQTISAKAHGTFVEI